MNVPTKHRYRLVLLALAAMGFSLSGCQNDRKDTDRVCSYRQDCEEGERCGANGKCTKEEQTCKTDSACSFDEFCKFSGSGDTGKCELAACSDASQCGTRATCGKEGVCKTDGCDSSDPNSCPSGEVCDPTLEQCIALPNSCRENSDCGQFQTCDKSAGKAVGECKYTGACSCDDKESCKTSPTGNGLCAIYGQELSAGGEMYCDPTEGKCQLESSCQTDRDCKSEGEGFICVSKRLPQGGRDAKICVQGCHEQSDCEKSGQSSSASSGTRQVYVCKQHPNPENNWKVCVIGCKKDSDCSSDGTKACLDNACVRTCVAGVVDSCLKGQLCKSPKSGVTFSICDNCRSTRECEQQIQGTECRPPEGTDLPSTDESDIGNYCSGPNGNCTCQEVQECPYDGFRTKEHHDFKESKNPYVIEDSSFVAEGGGDTTYKYTTEDVNGPLLCTDKKHARGDFFKFNAKPGYVVRVVAKTANAGSNLGQAENIDLQLLDCTDPSAMKPLLSSTRPPRDDKGEESVSYGSNTGKALCVNVTGSTIERVVKYDLIITQTKFTVCEEDELGDISEASKAHELTATSKETEIFVPPKPSTAGEERKMLHVCSDTSSPLPESINADWYKFTVEQNTYPEFIFDYDLRFGAPKIEFFEETSSGVASTTPLKTATEANSDSTTEVFGPTPVSSISSFGASRGARTRYRYRFATTVGANSGKKYYMKVSLPDGVVGQVDYQFSWILHENVCADNGGSNEEASQATPLKLPSASVTDFVYAPNASAESSAYEYNVCSKDFYKIELLPDHKLTAQFCYGGNVTDSVDGQPYVNVLKPSSDGSSFVRVEQSPSSINGADGSTCQEIALSTEDCDGRGGDDDICPGNYLLNFSLYSGTRVSYKLKYKSEELQGKTCTPRGTNRKFGDADVFNKDKAKAGTDNIRLGRVCDQNHDWYKVEVAKGAAYKFTLAYNATPETGDLDYTVYFVPSTESALNALSDANKELHKVAVTKATSLGVSSVTLNPTEDGVYYLDIYGDPAARVSYTLSLDYNGKGPAGGECPDKYEENNDLTHATVLTTGSLPGEVALEDLSVCFKVAGATRTEFPDYFKAELGPGEKATFVATPDANSNNNLGFQVKSCFAPFDKLNNCDTTVPANNKNWNSPLTLSTDVKGTVYYKVFGTYSRTADALLTTRYKVNFKKEKTTPACTTVASGKGDAEGNPIEFLDLPQQGYYSGELLCAGAAKYFKVKVPKKTSSNEKWSFATRYNRGAARLSVTVKQSGGSDVSVTPVVLKDNRQEEIGDLYTMDRPDVDTEYIVKVVPNNSQVKYFLLANMDHKGGSDPNDNSNGKPVIFERLICPDRFEENNEFMKGTKIGAGIDIQNLFLCRNGDTSQVFLSASDSRDYYKVAVPPQATLIAKAMKPDGTEDQVGVNLALYNGNTRVEDGSTSKVEKQNDTGSLKEYDLLAYPTGDSGIVEYKLKLEIKYNDGSCNSPAEAGGLYVTKNGKTAQESAIAGSAAADKYYTPGLTKLCEQTQQWYKVGTGVTSFDATLYYVTSYGKLDATLVSTDASGSDLKDATVTPVVDEAKGKVTINATSLDNSRVYYLKLTTPGDAGRAEYKLWYKTDKGTPTLAMCADPSEINDDATSATPLGQQIFHADNLNLCYADEDWFSVTKTGDYYVGLFGDNADKITINFAKPDGSGTPKTASGTSGAKVNELTVTSGDTDFPNNSNYIVKLTGDKSATSRPYLMLAGPATMFSTSCTPDEYEKGSGNNKLTAATLVPLFTSHQSKAVLYATHCSGDIDFYRILIPAGKKAKVLVYSKSDLDPKFKRYDVSVSGTPVTFTKGVASYDFDNTLGTMEKEYPLSIGEEDVASSYPYFILFEELP